RDLPRSRRGRPRPRGSLLRGSTPAAASRGAALPTLGPGRADPLAARALAAQPLDQDRIRGHRFRAVNELVEHLVVGGGGHPEVVGDRLSVGARLPPPGPLEREAPHLALGQCCHLPHALSCPLPPPATPRRTLHRRQYYRPSDSRRRSL